jgi:hypothetical protein
LRDLQRQHCMHRHEQQQHNTAKPDRPQDSGYTRLRAASRAAAMRCVQLCCMLHYRVIPCSPISQLSYWYMHAIPDRVRCESWVHAATHKGSSQ